MPDLDPATTMQTFAFTLSFKVGGIIDSDTTYDETKEVLLTRLSEVYGPGVVLEDFHAASETEINDYLSALQSDSEEETIN